MAMTSDRDRDSHHTDSPVEICVFYLQLKQNIFFVKNVFVNNHVRDRKSGNFGF